jgi:predicted amidohydrolase YtcJ
MMKNVKSKTFNSYLLVALISLIVSGCFKGKSVDLIVHNAQIHVMNENGDVYDAMAIKDGKIVEVGPERQILNKYSAEEEIDAAGKDVYPGFTDAHGHMLSYAKQLLSADLVGSKSFDEVLVRLEKYQSKHNRKFILGRGWDQSLWGTTEFPTNEQLNKLFPTTPVCLIRIDGHALLANDALLKLANITTTTAVDGGIIHLKDGKCTGLLVDNAMNSIYTLIPEYPKNELIQAMLDVQAELFQYGITGVHEAGIENKDIAYFKELIDQHDFRLNTYAMLMPSKENIAFARKNGIYHYKNLSIRSFKVMGDGALGSRGAFLKKPYSDEHNHFGVLTTPLEEMKRIATICELTGYQMNTHAIGDSTNNLLLNIYKGIFEVNKDHRWRIEHAQVVDPKDFALFSQYGIFASVQPTHAVSDQRWAEARLGKERMKGAYAYKSLLKQCGMLAIGTDFPIELTDPFLTIHAAVKRKNADNFPSTGFYSDESISLEECLKGMTIWAAYASFDEARLGTLEKGKEATFAIFENQVRANEEYTPNFATYTFIKGKKVYSIE